MERNNIVEDEVDLITLIQKVWKGKRVIIKNLVIFGLIGLFIAIFSPKEYTATTVMVPTSVDKGLKGNLSGLAAMAGINLSGGASDIISPALYPKIVESIPFKQELLATKINTSESEEPITYRKYYTEIHSLSLLENLKKYTVGLPGLVIKALRGEDSVDNSLDSTLKELIFISEEEKELYEQLDEQLSLDINDKEGFVELSATMPEAIPAAQLAENAQKLLQKIIVEVKSRKAREQLRFVEDRYSEKEKEFNKDEYALADFQDRNKNIISAKAKTIERQLRTQYNLSYAVYSELAKQIEQQKIQVEEDTPVFSIVEPVSVPVEKSKPKRLFILIFWLFLGGLVGVGTLLGRDFIEKLKQNN